LKNPVCNLKKMDSKPAKNDKLQLLSGLICSNVENLVLWAGSEMTGFAVIEFHGVLE